MGRRSIGQVPAGRRELLVLLMALSFAGAGCATKHPASVSQTFSHTDGDVVAVLLRHQCTRVFPQVAPLDLRLI